MPVFKVQHQSTEQYLQIALDAPANPLVLASTLANPDFSPPNSVQAMLQVSPPEKGPRVASDDFAVDGLMDDLEDEFGEPDEAVNDPFAGYNRVMTGFNDWFFLSILNPVAKGWKFVTPEPVRASLLRFFKNILYPVRFVNTVFQAKPVAALEETGRFVINSTVGLIGLFDPAKAWFGLEEHNEDFGQTLGYWGVGPGPHLVIPFLGPSNLRDAFALVPEWQLDPVSYVKSPVTQLGVRSFDQVNETSLDIGGYESLKKDAVDFYPFLRDVYEQNRLKKIEE